MPLPDVPTDVVRGGDWTLQRLVQEVTPPPPVPDGVAFATADAGGAEVLLEGPNQRASTTYRFDEPGTVEFACHLPGHYEYGMRGEIEVVPAS